MFVFCATVYLLLCGVLARNSEIVQSTVLSTYVSSTSWFGTCACVRLDTRLKHRDNEIEAPMPQGVFDACSALEKLYLDVSHMATLAGLALDNDQHSSSLPPAALLSERFTTYWR